MIATLAPTLALAQLVSAALPSGDRHAAASPVIVAVEATPDEIVTPTPLRDAIAHELLTPVLSPADEQASPDTAVLTVALEPRQAVVAVPRDAGVFRRAIWLPPDRVTRLRLVTWLVGNMVRDQTSDLLRSPERDAPAVAQNDVAWGAPAAGSAVRAHPTLARTAPLAADEAGATVARRAPRPATGTTAQQWTVALLAGVGFYHLSYSESRFDLDSHIQYTDLEVIKRGHTWDVGGLLGIQNGDAIDLGITFGLHHPHRWWIQPELSGALGLEVFRELAPTLVQTPDRGTIWGASTSTSFGTFARLSAGFAIHAADWIDIVTRATAHGNLATNQLAATVTAGLRCPFPW